MQIVCDACGVTGEPAEIWQSAKGTGLECASCGHINRVGAPSEQPESVEPEVARTEPEDEEPRAPVRAAKLLPVQCRKCGWRQEGSEACDRCGFVFANDRPGEMPWDRPTRLQEAAWAEAEKLWNAVDIAPTAENYAAFSKHCTAHKLEDYAARKLRFAVADRPDDALAAGELQKMVDKGRARFASVLEVDRDSAHGRAKRFKRSVTIVVFLLAILIAYLLFRAYPNLFPM